VPAVRAFECAPSAGEVDGRARELGLAVAVPTGGLRAGFPPDSPPLARAAALPGAFAGVFVATRSGLAGPMGSGADRSAVTESRGRGCAAPGTSVS
jgi:hypothetical protein